MIATAAALLLWPRWDRAKMLTRLGEVVRAFADGGLTDPGSGASDALGRFRAERPAGVMVHAASLREERCFRRVITALARLDRLAPVAPPDSPATARLIEGIEATLRASADLLAGRDAELPDPAELERIRLEHREDMQDRARELIRGGGDPADALALLDDSFAVRVASFVVLAIATNSLLLAGREVPGEEGLEIYPELDLVYESRLREGLRLARTWLRPGSARLRDALRAAVGLTLAVLVATVTEISHGFWVVLATLVVLRSNVRGTGRTAYEVIGGTVAGFVIASALVLVLGTGEAVLWAALPFAVFASTYLPGAVAAGQAGFAVFVVVLFNLFDPAGWEVGLVRVEDVLLGAAISLLVGALIWPRGVADTIRTAAAAAYRAAGAYLGAALAAKAPGEAAASPERTAAMEATILTADAIDQHRSEPGAELTEEGEYALLDGPRLVRAAADGWTAIANLYPGPHVEADEELAAGRALLAEIDRLAGEIESPPARADVTVRIGVHDDAMDAEALTALRAWGGVEAGQDGAGEGALRLVWERDWLRLLAEVLGELAAPAVEAGRTLRGSDLFARLRRGR